MRISSQRARQGLTLLEIILSIAILSVSLAAIGELLRIGSRSAKDARDLSRAQIHCQSKLAELTAGISY
ncbi:MAG: type II secretion system protein, partial [Planctomycetes bacterium]|nr:type II secretion system protein [Planctomycetota bacterium]